MSATIITVLPFAFLYFFIYPSLWAIREGKAINFWLYLWQLKEYHIGRFIDHFRTAQGRALLINKALALKIFIILLCFFGGWLIIQTFNTFDFLENYRTKELAGSYLYVLLFGVTIIIYIFEGIRAVIGSIKKKNLIPVPTPKIHLLKLVLHVPIALVFLSGALIFSMHVLLGVVNPSFSVPQEDSPGVDLTRFASVTWLIWPLLLYDVLTPLIVSIVVLMFQPFAVLGRNRILAKARAKRQKMQGLKVVGITGSYGKTSTKEILAHILASKFRVTKTKEHQNSEVGVSRAILDELILKHEVFICEMGAYNKGGIRLLASIAQPQIAVLLGANEQHLATFGSMENLLAAEGGKELIDALPAGGLAIFNGANIYAKKLYQETTKKKILIGPEGSLSAEEVKAEQEKITFWVRAQDGSRAFFEAPLLGAHNAENILLAAAAALELGMTLEEIAQACRTIPQSAGAMTSKRGKGGLHIIDSSYSANPSGVLADLEYLKVWPGKKVVVMPSLIELGDASKDVHLKIGKKIAAVCDLAIITTQDHISDIQEGAGRDKDRVVFLGNWEQIVERVQSFCQAGDVILLEGRVSPHIMQHLTV